MNKVGIELLLPSGRLHRLSIGKEMIQITMTLTEINVEIEKLKKAIQFITGSGGRIERYTQLEEVNLKHYEAELKKWENLRNSHLE